MTIYIEYVIIDNIVMNYLILRLIELTISRTFQRFNKVIVCVLGSIFALVLPLLIHYKIMSFLYKITTSIILVLCLKKYKKFKDFLIYYLMFFTYTFFLGGVCLGVIELLGIEYTMSSIVMYEFDFPVGWFVIVLLLIIKVMMKVVKVIKVKMKNSCYINKIKLCDGEKTADGYALLDSGNNVKFDGKGVSIVSIDMFMKMYSNIKIYDLILNKKLSLRDSCYITIKGIGSGEKYLSFVMDCIEIEGKKFSDQRVAIALKNFNEYDVILSNEFIGGKI